MVALTDVIQTIVHESRLRSIPIITVLATPSRTMVAMAIAGAIWHYQDTEAHTNTIKAANPVLKAIVLEQTFLQNENIAPLCNPCLIRLDFDDHECSTVRFGV